MRFIGCSIIAHNITSIKDIESLLSSPYNRYEVIILLNQQHNPATAQHIIKHYRLTRVNNDLTRDCPLHIANLYRSTCRTYRRLVLVDCDSTDIYSTMNAAIGFASYDYIIPLQPHTCLLPHALESIVTTLSDSSNNNIGLLYNNTISPCYVFQRDVLISYGGVSNDIIKKLPRHAVIHSDLAFAYPNEYKDYSCLILIPLIVPVNCPLWIIALATAFAVIFAKEVFGGTGMNVFNPALVTRAFLFFAYPTMMSGDKVWVNGNYMDCINGAPVDGVSAATPLGQLAAGEAVTATPMETIIGTIPGSIGETSGIAILIGAFILIWANIASWKIILSTFIGGAVMAYLLPYEGAQNFEWWEQLTVGGFCFGAVFMATDPVTSPRTEGGKWIFGFLIGAMAIIIRVLNPGYPEGMMLAILLMNIFAPLFDYCFVQSNINMRVKRAAK